MARIEYKLKDGTPIPGVTTVIDQNLGWSKPGLIGWANKVGRQGMTTKEASAKALDIGSVAHEMIRAYLKNEPLLDLPVVSKEITDKAATVYLMCLEWFDQHKVKPIMVEQSLVHEQLRYGGTPDLIAEVDGKISIVDWKSSNDIYPEQRIQVAAYGVLYDIRNQLEDGIEAYHLIRLGKEKPEFEHTFMLDLLDEWEIFKLLLKLNEYKQKLK